jgi:nitrilase
MQTKPFIAAAVQASPVYLDREATIDKACGLIADAASQGARLIVFPEAFVPGYPDWVWVVPPGAGKAVLNEMHRRLTAAAVSIPDAGVARLGKAAKAAKAHVAIGVHERNVEASGATLYNTLLFLGPDGEILGRHRKLMPTAAERMVWGQGDGASLRAIDTPLGRLGGLLCWENFMPLARQALYQEGVQVHAAPTWDSSPGWLDSMKHVAKEGGMFVVSCCQAIRMDEIPDALPFKELYPEGREWVNKGNSCIVDPRGRLLAGPLEAEQGLLLAEIDLDAIAEWKWQFDAAGHYARPDVFDFSVRPRARDADD